MRWPVGGGGGSQPAPDVSRHPPANLATETAALDRAKGARSAYSVGLWLISKDAVGYGVSNAPYREDVSAFDWTALTTGADAAASPVVKANIQGLIDWSRR